MAQSQTGFDMTEYQYELDCTATDVMPDHWAGHARVATFEAADDLDRDATEFAVTLANRLAQKKPDASPDAIAAAVLKQTRKKFL